MKQLYTFISLFLITLTGFTQGYQFGIVHNTGNNFSIIAVPDFNATNTDISDIGFTLMLPAGNSDITNMTSFNGRVWTATQVTEAQFQSASSVNSNGRDGFALNLPPGQTILSHTLGQQIVILSFDVSNMPTSGKLELLSNTDPIAVALGGALDSFYNSNINSTTTQDYFSGFVSGMESFLFSSLGEEGVALLDIRLKIYPNPVSSTLTIETPFIDNYQLQVVNQLGQQVLKQSQNTSSTSIDVSNFSKGLYFLNIHSETGKIATIKFIKN